MRFLRLIPLFAVPFISPLLHAQAAWTFARTNIPNITSAYSIAYGNGRFVVTLIGNGNNLPAAAWSTDGVTWTAAKLTFGPATSVAFVAGAFYLAGSGTTILRSIDGDTWQTLYSSNIFRSGLNSITSDGRSIVSASLLSSPLALVYSPDRDIWREMTAPLEFYVSSQLVFLSGLATFNGRFYATYFATSPSGSIGSHSAASTIDGTTWTISSVLPGATYLASGNGRLVGFAPNNSAPATVVTSDAVNFTITSVAAQISGNGNLAFAGDRFFFLNSLSSSADGISWGPVASFATGNFRQMRGIAYGKGRFIAVGGDFTGNPASGFVFVEVIASLLAPVSPLIASTPLDRTVVEGSPTTFTVTLENLSNGTTFQWRREGALIAGATSTSLTLSAVKPVDAGRYTVEIRNSFGTTLSDSALLTVAPPIIAPSIASAPASLTVLAGERTTLSVTATGTAPFVYQWLRDGAPLVGATSNIFVLDATLLANAGAYSVIVINSAGTVTTSAATLTVTPIGRISNLSVLTSLTTSTDNFTLGYVVGGADTTTAKPLVIRAAGPSLGALGVAGTLDDPKLELFAGATKTGENDNWGGAASLATAITNVGAFPYFGPLSKDSAVTANITTRDNSIKISSANNGTGTVIAEIYDATSPASFTTATPRLLNVSVLKSIGPGLTVGFTLAGSSAKTVLIRAIGPTLGTVFGVAGTVADPQLTLFNSASAKIAENNDWSGTAALTAAFSSVGAFGLPANSKDAALLVTLPPGGYTAQVSGVAGTTGTALVEIYEVP